MQTITSQDILPDIEHHFRISAGPGAGKTHWLTEHIRNILHKSVRMAATRRIACITYTNIAVETILKRLGTSVTRVEVSTIHSFLYENIIKPYVFLVADEYGLDVSQMDGHDDTILSNYGFLSDWKAKTSQVYLRDDKEIAKAFSKIQWKFKNKEELEAKPSRPYAVNGTNIKTASYMVYKRMAWEKGIMHHDDVLFFSYQIIKKHPFILEVLRANFPYIFIDEFQDSSPIQVKIFQAVGQKESIIGIIGDTAQSIYVFQGSDPAEFKKFKLKGMKDYVMEDNRRSTNEIIDVLNITRTDIKQKKYRNIEGNLPFILIGERSSALAFAQSHCGTQPVYSLSRHNITANAMKKEISGAFNSKLFDELSEKDKPGSGNKYRSSAVASCLKAVEYARVGKFKDSIKEMERQFKYESDPFKRKSIALNHIVTLLEHYEGYSKGTLYDFFLLVKGQIKTNITNLGSGVAKEFYVGHSYQNMALCVKIPEDISQHKTIHKAKGDEFDNVLVITLEESDLDFLITPDFAKEVHRLHYVAASRAREKLFISVPALSLANQNTLEKYFTIKTI
ncbi:UvrD-helicase domain-containing protein [Flavobacterium hydatis]|uniref:DNA 3'-5' helicase n=1 Tax=Flavobacterium hydatis TaxID=991 RepID=A0A086AIL0_FLAHY|nr:ATP-dependent helicase [Flavobacterium hydatis]KFF16524.1 DNA helicase UvrD [Flavobacterium hydatis]OXA93921.1 DNA helicase UvrD [Flavobacterium hydatis]